MRHEYAPGRVGGGVHLCGATVEIDGRPVVIASVGRPFVRDGGQCCYGYTDQTSSTSDAHLRAVARAAREGDAASRYSEDEIYEAVQAGHLSVSDAMNQDM